MVLDPPRQPVNITRIMIYSLIPILNIYAAWRIQIFWLMLAITVGAGVAYAPLNFIVSFPPNLLIIIPIDSVVSLVVTRHYSRKYNAKIANERRHSSMIKTHIVACFHEYAAA